MGLAKARWLVDEVRKRRWLLIALESAAALAIVAALAVGVRGDWDEAGDRIAQVSFVDLGLALAWLAAYYLLFVVGWMWMLSEWGIRLHYRDALQAEMVSMLAKYIPGGVWTPAARVVAVRRAGITNTSLVLSSILLEAGLSAVSGVLVFFVGMTRVDGVDANLILLVAFAVLVAVALHPRVFGRLARVVFKPFGGDPPPPLRFQTLLGLLAYYAFTWLVGGAALYFLLRSVGGTPSLWDIPFLGGISAVGAIVAVLVVIAPSGLGVREGAMYGLLLAVVNKEVALGAIVLNRLAITLVEGALLLLGGLFFRLTSTHSAEVSTEP